MAITTIAFDLDDTLLNTSGLLVPAASKQAFNILIEHGLKISLDECERQRREAIKTISHKDLFLHLAKTYGTKQTLAAVEKATRAFYEPQLPEHLPLIDGAESIIHELKNKYHLYIVTAGYESGQKNKIKSLKIGNLFKGIFVVNNLNNERKIDAFRQILTLENIQPENLLCIGNSLSSEIRDAKELGAVSCYFEFGEDRGKIPTDPKYRPDYHIKEIGQLTDACKI